MTSNQLDPSHVFYKSHTITITYDEEISLGKAVWQGTLSSQDFKEALLLCVHAIDKYNLKFWLADNRRIKGILKKDQQWMKEHVVPSLIMGSLNKIATLVPEDIKSAEAVNLIYDGAHESGYLLLQDFNSEQDALNWLLEEESK